MRERLIFIFACEVTAFALCVINTVFSAAFMAEDTVLFVLAGLCMISLKLLLNLLLYKRIIKFIGYILFIAAAVMTYFAFGISPYAVLPLAFALFGSGLYRRFEYKNEMHTKISEENTFLKEQLTGRKFYERNAEDLARLNERNRIALRLHDKIGHGVSGSVLLIEGAMTIIDKDSGTAKSAINTATENLRQSVDEIRAILRSERETAEQADKAAIADILLKFGEQQPDIKTHLTTDNTETIPPDIWRCIRDCLREALVNTAKHSKGVTEFNVRVTADKWLTCAEFADNGNVVLKSFVKSTGLTGMEERAAMSDGRCFFNTEKGFKVTLIFRAHRY